MALNLLNSFGKRGVSYGLLTTQVDVIDTDYLSKYFVVSEFSPTFTAGRNSFSFNGSPLLKPGSEVLIECLDSAGNNLFIEMGLSTNAAAKTYPYKEATAFVFGIHVYNDTADGVGKLILYGTLNDDRSVKWTRNITIDKTLSNSSKIRFYNRPTIGVEPIQVPVLSTGLATALQSSFTFTGYAHAIALNPPKDTNLPTVNRRNIDIDYRLAVDSPFIDRTTPSGDSVNSQMVGSIVNVSPLVIQAPLSTTEIVPFPQTQSFIVMDVTDNKTIKLIDPYFYSDGRGNKVVTNIVSSSFSVEYPYIAYNTSTSSYLQTNINGNLITIYDSYADVVYRNIRTFTGFLARHKVYRKSLYSNADFSIVADEPLFVNEKLIDNLTQNKFYDKLGKFYNQDHIRRYWFTSSIALSMIHTPDKYIDSVFISSPIYQTLTGSDYLMVKNDSVTSQRNATYVPFNEAEFNATSGSSYDSNFIDLKSNVQYLLQISAVVEKADLETEARLDVYFTSSVVGATQDTNFTSKFGIKLASLEANIVGPRKIFDDIVGFYTPPIDLYGTLVIVPYKCQAYIKNMSFRVYGDDGFSPDVFVSRIPWPISVANETYQIKAELFDINHKLVYSDLNIIQNFDPSGSTLVPYIPGTGIVQPGTLDVFVSGSLYVSKSIFVLDENIIVQQGNIFIPNILPRPEDVRITQSRVMAVRGDNVGELAYTTIVDATSDNQHIRITNGPLSLSSTASLISRYSLASIYNSQAGGHIYYVAGVKNEERPTGY